MSGVAVRRTMIAGVGVWLALAAPAAAQAPDPRDSSPRVSTQTTSASPDADLHGPHQLIHDLAGDFLRLPSKSGATWLGVTGGVTLLAHQADLEIAEEVREAGDVNAPFALGNLLGNGFVQIGGALAVYGIGLAMPHPGVADVGAGLLRAQALAGTLTTAIKLAVRRERPDGGSFSFPSFHASASFATADVLRRHLGWKIGAPAYAVAAYVGASRVATGHHYLSDVVFGAGLGLLAGDCVARTDARRRINVVPMITPHGTMVAVVVSGAP
jgi:membrane-associated phospholipid phosphatase